MDRRRTRFARRFSLVVVAVAVTAYPVAVTGWARPSLAAATATPTFVQQVTAHSGGVTTLSVTPVSALQVAGRLVVEVGIWNASAATASAVTDAAGDSFIELTHFKAADGTELSVWSAPVGAGAGTRPAVTAKATSTADIGVAALEYTGLSTVSDTSVVDQQSHAVGLTGTSATVSSGPTAAATAGNEIAVGFYADSGFGDVLTAGANWTARASIAPTGDMELFAQDQTVSVGNQPSAATGTGAATYWLMATVVLRPATSGPATAPAAPTSVLASAANSSATVTWTAPTDGGSGISSYTVTPISAGVAQSSTVVLGTPPTTSTAITGLTNGTSYTFVVSATNIVGTGPSSKASNLVTPSTAPLGQWSSLQTWPIVAVHAVALNNGKYLVWDGWQQPEPTQVWDPTTNTFTTVVAPDSIFCSGNAHLTDGRVLVVGGYGTLSTGQIGIRDTTIFDPATSTWTRVADMNQPRWYPSLLELADGRFLALSGNSTDATHWADTPEVYDPTANTWTLLSKVATSQIHEEEYPFTYLLPNGRVFAMGPSEDVSYSLDVTNQTWTPIGGSGVTNGSSVMYLPGKILYSGGASSVVTTTPAQAATTVIDATSSTPAWRQTAPMANPRVYHTLTMLADGTVLAVGGEPSSDQTNATTGVLPSEIWNPATETWSTVAPIAAARNYHSAAVLMPDGRVLVAGGGHEESLNNPGQYSAQVYSPPYLFKGARPTIGSAPSTATYGTALNIGTSDAASIAAVNLVSLGADTHQADMGQHFVPLNFTANGGGLTVQSPGSAAIAPPGDYLLFIVNGGGVPSVAARIHIAAAAPVTPAAPSAVIATAGNGSAQLTWTAPADGGSSITGYTVTPYVGSLAQTPIGVAGNPPATTATVNGLINGTSYTFAVTATNNVGVGPASAASNAVTPSIAQSPVFVQQISAHGTNTRLSVTPTAATTIGNRLIVEVGVWSSQHATAKSVTDTAGNVYTEVTHFTAGDGAEQSVWTAPITAGGSSRPTITVTASSAADLGVAALEYAGLSAAAGTAAVDQVKTASGTTGTTTSVVSSGPTAPAATSNELALGFYADSGFGDALTSGPNWAARVSVAPAGDMEFMVEDQPVSGGAAPNAAVSTGPRTTWIMSTIVFRHA